MWALDLTAGRVPENEKNALLCRGSKQLMCQMAESGYPPPLPGTLSPHLYCTYLIISLHATRQQRSRKYYV